MSTLPRLVEQTEERVDPSSLDGLDHAARLPLEFKRNMPRPPGSNQGVAGARFDQPLSKVIVVPVVVRKLD